eukprot:TRINITY_DN65_c0_g1_i3.p1 TRINITY_DN65_c0_g1~~TRINITY_DN65_c0_g1_i3.p1  ORF type:complete len:429 (+),score=129.85 TRINITY_DN65_c0_g1_i3:105-1289(+)
MSESPPVEPETAAGAASEASSPTLPSKEPSVPSDSGAAAPAPADGERFYGVVKSLSWATGYGFIQCDETAARYQGRDVFFYKNELRQTTGQQRPLAAGSRVSFLCVLNEKSQPQARDVLILEGGATDSAQPSTTETAFQGFVKSLRAKEGYGFIECRESHEKYQRDVFLHRRQAHGLTVGAAVAFNVQLNPRGMPQARDVVPLAGGHRGYGGPVAAPSSRWYQGVVKSNSEHKGFGFIQCDETMKQYGRDVYLDSNFGYLRAGQQLRFRVTVSRAGMPQASDVELIRPRAPQHHQQMPFQNRMPQRPQGSRHGGMDMMQQVPGGRRQMGGGPRGGYGEVRWMWDERQQQQGLSRMPDMHSGLHNPQQRMLGGRCGAGGFTPAPSLPHQAVHHRM